MHALPLKHSLPHLASEFSFLPTYKTSGHSGGPVEGGREGTEGATSETIKVHGPWIEIVERGHRHSERVVVGSTVGGTSHKQGDYQTLGAFRPCGPTSEVRNCTRVAKTSNLSRSYSSDIVEV